MYLHVYVVLYYTIMYVRTYKSCSTIHVHVHCTVYMYMYVREDSRLVEIVFRIHAPFLAKELVSIATGRVYVFASGLRAKAYGEGGREGVVVRRALAKRAPV